MLPGAVEAPAPVSTSGRLVPRHRKADSRGWQTSAKLGWDFANHSTDHELQAVVSGAPVTYGVKRELGTPTSFDLRVRADAPAGTPISLQLFGAGSFGQGRVTADQAILPSLSASAKQTDFALSDIRAGGGARWLALDARPSRIGIGLEGALLLSDAMTLNSARTQLAVESRTVVDLAPVVEYRYEPSDNWGAEVAVSGGLALSAGGASSELRLDQYRRWRLELELSRYLSEESALGLGVLVELRRQTWVVTSPTTLTDPLSASVLKIGLFWKRDL